MRCWLYGSCACMLLFLGWHSSVRLHSHSHCAYQGDPCVVRQRRSTEHTSLDRHRRACPSAWLKHVAYMAGIFTVVKRVRRFLSQPMRRVDRVWPHRTHLTHPSDPMPSPKHNHKPHGTEIAVHTCAQRMHACTSVSTHACTHARTHNTRTHARRHAHTQIGFYFVGQGPVGRDGDRIRWGRGDAKVPHHLISAPGTRTVPITNRGHEMGPASEARPIVPK